MAQAPSAGLPEYADIVVVGGGTSGPVVAGRLAEQTDHSVLVLEAGPDYGRYDSGAWPPELVDGRTAPFDSHSWSYVSSAKHGQRDLALERARVIGGCSAHNGCAAVWGHRLDYDAWAAAGNPGWDMESLLPLFRSANERMRVQTPVREALGPFQEPFLDAAPAVGLPLIPDLNDVDGPPGMAVSPINVWNGARWNAAFGYLDPLRGRPNLAVRGNITADRLVVENGRVTGVDVIGPAGPARVRAGEVVVSCGAYGSPALLLRSGIGAPEQLRGLGIEVAHALPGVGENLHDHPAYTLQYGGTEDLFARAAAFMAGHVLREEGTIAKARSSLCREAFDLHIYPIGSPYWFRDGRWLVGIPVATMTPRSRGSVRIASRDPREAPLLDHGYLTDPEDHDLHVLLDGIELTRQLAAQPALARVLGEETGPGPEYMDRETLREYIRANSVHYYHPSGTCKLGPAADPQAVVDARGRVHGLQGVRVADASIMPQVPRANTNIPCVVVGEKIAQVLLEDLAGGA